MSTYYTGIQNVKNLKEQIHPNIFDLLGELTGFGDVPCIFGYILLHRVFNNLLVLYSYTNCEAQDFQRLDNFLCVFFANKNLLNFTLKGNHSQ